MRTNPFRPFLDRQGFVLLDGGLATALESAGHRLDTALWSARVLLDAPESVADVHRDYLEAGADCIATATYQASLEGLRGVGLDEREAEDVLRRAVRLATDARDAFWSSARSDADRLRPLVAASVGPYGAYLADGSEYDGRYGVDRDRLRDFHRRRLEILATAGADLVAFETIPSAPEAEVLLELLGDLDDTWAWLSFSCADGRRLWDGTPLRDVVQACAGHPALAAVGVNCTAPRHVRSLLESIRDVAGVPLLAYPNSGESFDAETKRWGGDADAAAWLEDARGWIEVGARIVGGCCRVGPDLIRRLRVEASAVRRDARIA